jgi:hypothetical protein
LYHGRETLDIGQWTLDSGRAAIISFLPRIEVRKEIIMPNRITYLSFATAVLVGTALLQAQDAPPAGAEGNAPPPRQNDGGRGGPGEGQRGMRPGGPMQGLDGRNDLEPFIAALADLNLGPDFNLTAEQETKIADIRQAFKKSVETWRTDHEDQLNDLREQVRSMRRGQGNEERQKVMDSIRDLVITAPNGDAEVKEIKALLNEDQARQVEAREASVKAENDRQREQMQQRWGNRRGGNGADNARDAGPAGNGQPGDAQRGNNPRRGNRGGDAPRN